MPRRRYIFDPPERFITGTVGDPWDRTFFLQAREGGRVVSVVLEKVQVAVLAERLGELLGELERRGLDSPPTPPTPPTPAISVTPPAETPVAANEDTGPLDEPLIEAFRAGSLTLGWDQDADLVLVEAPRPG